MGYDRVGRPKLMKRVFLSIFFILQTLFATEISYSLDGREFKHSHSVYLLAEQNLTLKFKVSDAESIRWYQIIPDTSKFYKNANYPWEENAYKWSGYGKIDYQRVEVEAFKNRREVLLSSAILELNRPKNNHFYNTKLGSFWFEAEARLKNGKVVKSYGLKDNTKRGLSPKVFRVSYMLDRSYIGYLTSFFNVPGIFGSMPYQSRNFIGVDCADVLVATSKVMNHEKNEKNYNVMMLVDKLKVKKKFKIEEGKPDKKLKWGEAFVQGDFLAVKYSKNGRYAHIGMLYADENKNGLLDRDDTIINAGPNTLHVTTLGSGAFNGTVVILKNRDMK